MLRKLFFILLLFKFSTVFAAVRLCTPYYKANLHKPLVSVQVYVNSVKNLPWVVKTAHGDYFGLILEPAETYVAKCLYSGTKKVTRRKIPKKFNFCGVPANTVRNFSQSAMPLGSRCYFKSGVLKYRH